MKFNKVMVISLIVIIAIIIFFNIDGKLTLSETLNVGLITALVFVTFMYVIETENIVLDNRKQRKIALLEKKLDEVYSPLLHTLMIAKELYRALIKKEAGMFLLFTEGYFKMDGIFEKYHHLIDKKIRDEWMFRTADKEIITKFRFGGVTKGTNYPFKLYRMLDLVQEKIEGLKKEYNNLIK